MEPLSVDTLGTSNKCPDKCPDTCPDKGGVLEWNL